MVDVQTVTTTTQVSSLGDARSIYDGYGLQGREVVEEATVWMEDGNVIVAAGVQPISLFKCHRSMLSKGSDILSGLFTLPALSAAETYKGLPVVPLYDAREDVQSFLSILYDAALSFDVRQLGTVNAISGPLRLAKKYMMDGLYQRLVAILERDWPASYEKWAAIQESLQGKVKEVAHQSRGVSYPYADFYPDPVVHLARELQIDTVLPVALYELHRWFPPDPDLNDLPVDILDVTVDAEALSMEGLKLCLYSKAALDRFSLKIFSGLTDEFADERGNWRHQRIQKKHGACAEGMAAWLFPVISHALYRGCLRDPISALKSIAEDLTSEPRVRAHSATLGKACYNCRNSFAGLIRNEITKLWEALPGCVESP